jgi:hypothetical protein
MGIQYKGPEFMEPYFYPCPNELGKLLPKHNICQGIRCLHDHKQLNILKRADLPAIFAQCKLCGHEFKIYANGDYPAGQVPDDPSRPLTPLKCNNCGEQVFEIAVGYEYPGDEIDSTDISWFTVVGKCLKCNTLQELFTDETA